MGSEVSRLLIRLWRMLFLWREAVVIYTYAPRQGSGNTDNRVRVFDGKSAIPRDVIAEFQRSRSKPLWWVMWFRMKCRGAKLLYLSNEGRLWGYGWIERADPFLRRYRWITLRGTLLGYFWISPSQRGRGLYRHLLEHSIAICEDRKQVPLIVYADLSNQSSIRGLEKAGFARLGEYCVTSRLFGLVCRHTAISQEQTVADVLAGIRHPDSS